MNNYSSTPGPKRDGPAQRITLGFGIFFVFLLVLAACLCWCLFHICFGFNGNSRRTMTTGPVNNRPNGPVKLCPHLIYSSQSHTESQASARIEQPLNNRKGISKAGRFMIVSDDCHGSYKTKVEETQSSERTSDSVFEPDPITSLTIYNTIKTAVDPQPDFTTSANYHHQSNIHEFKQLSDSSDLHNIRQTCNTKENMHDLPVDNKIDENLSIVVSSENHNRISNSSLHKTKSSMPLPTIPEHPMSVSHNTTRKLSGETPKNTSLNLDAPATSSMPDLNVPSTSLATHFPPKNLSRLLFYRNNNIDVHDIQNSNPELDVSNDEIYLSLDNSNDSAVSNELPEQGTSLVELHKYDDSTNN